MTAERWLGAPMPDHPDGASLLVRRYLAAYGPATREDLLRFGGLRVKDVQPGFEENDGRLVRFEAEDGRTLYDLKRAPRPPADTPAPIRLRTLPPEYQPAVIKKNGDVLQTSLVDGVVAGLWTYADGKVKTEPFAPLPRAVRREVEDEARRLEAFLE
ncbi:MAG TPA: crosslink repair DNA glycosylase YcaQ family protein [Gaiellaceae bacterium]